jgi:hypothetical protein
VSQLDLYKCRRQKGRYDSYVAVATWREAAMWYLLQGSIFIGTRAAHVRPLPQLHPWRD